MPYLPKISLPSMVETLRSVTETFNRVAQYQLLLFHPPDSPPDADALRLVALTWGRELLTVLPARFSSLQSFYAGDFLSFPQLDRFDLFWMLHPGVVYVCPIYFDPFLVAENASADYFWSYGAAPQQPLSEWLAAQASAALRDLRRPADLALKAAHGFRLDPSFEIGRFAALKASGGYLDFYGRLRLPAYHLFTLDELSFLRTLLAFEFLQAPRVVHTSHLISHSLGARPLSCLDACHTTYPGCEETLSVREFQQQFQLQNVLPDEPPGALPLDIIPVRFSIFSSFVGLLIFGFVLTIALVVIILTACYLLLPNPTPLRSTRVKLHTLNTRPLKKQTYSLFNQTY